MSALEQLHSMVGKNENILWSGKPNFKCFILESIFNPLLPFSLVMGLVGGFCIFMMSTGSTTQAETPAKFIIFLCIFVPLCSYLSGILFARLRYQNTSFLVTDKGVYISGGIFALTFQHKPFMDISHVNLHRGIIDRMLGVGDVIITTNQALAAGGSSLNDTSSGMINLNLSIYDIPDYQHVYNLVKQVQQNIYSDVQYPNDLRPKENHGYNTKYVPPVDKKD